MESRNLYISDLHLFHRNVTKAGKNYDDRPYENIEEMNKDILKRWNNAVENSDHVYICGDFIWKLNMENRDEVMKIIKEMNGNLHLIIGNHDRIEDLTFTKRFDEIVPYKKMTDILYGREIPVILSHYYMPFYDTHNSGGILLHGHSHNTDESKVEKIITDFLNKNGFPAKIYNVGCMQPYMNYTPRTLREIVKHYEIYEMIYKKGK